jgi:hypothetical protein
VYIPDNFSDFDAACLVDEQHDTDVGTVQESSKNPSHGGEALKKMAPD